MSAWQRSSVLAVLGILLLSGLGVAISNEASALPTSDPLWTATQPANAFPQVAITKDGRYIAYTNSEENTLSLYDVMDLSGEPLWTKTFEGTTGYLFLPVAFSGDGTQVAVATHQNNVIMYSVPGGAQMWNAHLNRSIYSLAVDLDGSDTYIGVPDAVFKLDDTGLFDAEYYYTVGGEAYVVDTNDEGDMVIAVSSSALAILNEDLLEYTPTLDALAGTVFSPGKVADGCTVAAWGRSDGYLGYFALFIGGTVSYTFSYVRDLNIGYSGSASLDISDDGSTIFGCNGDTVFMYDVNTMTFLWSITTMQGMWGQAYLTGDGGLAMLGGTFLGASLFGRDDGVALENMGEFDLVAHALSSNGATAVVCNQTDLYVYRSALDLSLMLGEGSAYYGQTAVVNVLVTLDGVPLEGAAIYPSFSLPGVTSQVTDLGQGLYQIYVLLDSGVSPQTLRVDVIADAVGQQPAHAFTTIVLSDDPFALLAAQIDASHSDLSTQMTMMWAALSAQISAQGTSSEANLTGRITALGNSITSQLTALSSSVATVQNSVNGLGSAWAATDSKVNAIQVLLGTVATNVSYTRSTLDDLSTSITLISNRLTTLQNGVTEIRTACTNMQSSLTALTTSMTALRAQVSGLDASVAGVAAQLNAMYIALNGTMSSITELQSSVAQANEALVQVQGDVNSGYANLSANVTSLQAALGTNMTLLQNSVSQLGAQINSVSGNVTAVNTQLGTVSTAVNAIQSNTDDIKGKSDNSFLFGVLGMIVTVAMGLLIVFLLTRKKKDFK